MPVLIGAAVLGTGAATAAVVLRPQRPDDQPRNQVRQALFAGEQAVKDAPACRRVKAATPRLVDDPVPAWLVGRLGVLRRPATSADRVPGSRLSLGGSVVLRRSVRVARAPDGWTYRLWLSRGAIGIGAVSADPVGCARVRRDAAVAAAAGFSAEVRREVAIVVDQQLAAATDDAAGRRLQFSLVEARPDGRITSGGAGGLGAGHVVPAFGSSGTIRVHGRLRHTLSGLVPDGIATVRIVDEAGSPRVRPITRLVHDNVFHVVLPAHMGPKMTAEWRAGDGHVVRRTHPHF